MAEDSHVYMRELATDRWPWNQGSLVRLAQWVPAGATVLELGPASGYFTRHLSQELGCIVDAVELHPAMADKVRPWCRDLVVGDLESLDLAQALGGNAYRTIIVADVLEHLRDPRRLLVDLRKLLAPEGQILISVPNVAYAGLVADLAAGDFVYRDEGLLDRTHLRFFTRDSLQALLHEVGLYPWAWAAVELPLNESEFDARLETLPRALSEALTASPHAFCYQWLVAAGATEPATPPAEVPACPRDRFPVRVSWGGPGSGANYERSVVAWGEVGNERQVVRVPLPQLDRASLRVFLADRPAFVRVHSARLVSSDGSTRWSWQASEGASRLARATHAIGLDSDGEGCHATLWGAESWLELACPDVAFPEGGGALELDVGWPMSADFIAARRGWLAATGALQREVERLEAMVAERDAALARRDALVAPTRENLALATAPEAGSAPSASAMPDSRAGPGPAFRARPAVDIVIPVYNAPADLVRCVESVLAHTKGACRLVLIDDASPDAAIGACFAELAHRALPHLMLLRNERNLGFTATANLGIALGGEVRADVVLLNSDTLVTEDWLGALVRCAASDRRIGTITPFSNNAEICSFPRFCENNPWPEGKDPEPVRAALAAAAVPSYPDLPTGVGFCMYIRRALVDAIGAFDPAFGPGYGEENDFCLRAANANWRNVLCDDAFVVHLGGRSFAGRKAELGVQNTAVLLERHSSYLDLVRAYIVADPLRPIREAAITQLRVRTGSALGVLHVVGPRVDALERHLRGEVAASAQPCRHYLARSSGDAWEIEEWRADDPPVTYALARQPAESSRAFVQALCATFGIGYIQVHDPSLSSEGLQALLSGIGLPCGPGAPDHDFACPPPDSPHARPPFVPLAPARVRDALGYRAWTPPRPATPAFADAASAPAPAPATDSSDLATRAARVALRWRHTPAGRVLYRLMPPSILAALKARLR